MDVDGACGLESRETDVRHVLRIQYIHPLLCRQECRKRQVDKRSHGLESEELTYFKQGEGDIAHYSAISKLKTTCDLCERGEADRCETIAVVDGK
jgi:hypothetical protein